MRTNKLRNGIALLGMTMLFLSLFCVVGVEASTITPDTLGHKTPVSFEFTNVPGEEFDRLWHSGLNDKIFHSRGYDHYGEVWGDLEGTLFYDGDVNLNFETFDGTGGGVIYFEVSYGDMSGTFEGKMVFKIYMDEGTPFVDGKFVCHGDGDFEGLHLKGTYLGILGTTYLADAILLNPKC